MPQNKASEYVSLKQTMLMLWNRSSDSRVRPAVSDEARFDDTRVPRRSAGRLLGCACRPVAYFPRPLTQRGPVLYKSLFRNQSRSLGTQRITQYLLDWSSETSMIRRNQTYCWPNFWCVCLFACAAGNLSAHSSNAPAPPGVAALHAASPWKQSKLYLRGGNDMI